MSTHNIGFYEDLTKIIFELSSNTHLISSAVNNLVIYFEPLSLTLWDFLPTLDTRNSSLFKVTSNSAADAQDNPVVYLELSGCKV